jgi:hypothetical protein
MTTIESEWKIYWNRRPAHGPHQLQTLIAGVSQLAFYAGGLGLLNCLFDAHANKEKDAIKRLHEELLQYVAEVASKA